MEYLIGFVVVAIIGVLIYKKMKTTTTVETNTAPYKLEAPAPEETLVVADKKPAVKKSTVKKPTAKKPVATKKPAATKKPVTPKKPKAPKKPRMSVAE